MRDAREGTMEALRNREFMLSYPAGDELPSPHLTLGSSLVSTSSDDSSPDKRGKSRSLSLRQ